MSTHTKGVLCDPHEILDLVAAGDISALDHMTRCYGDRLLSVGRRYCRHEEDAHDAVQDALLAAGRNLQSFRSDGSLEGWLVRIVTNACARQRRGRKNDPSLHTVEVELADAPDGSPEEEAWRGQVAAALGEALLVLSPVDRLILLLSDAEGWTGPQIAERVDLSHPAVRTRLSRARARLREHLRDLNAP
ncbi:MAG: sigma-70 family RNA polymerase sigma factor [Deltaproteobacteria bacterium]|nr:sigma-70 family RNA polymerase sigma factor [Deltaproteobacteria bacterium]